MSKMPQICAQTSNPTTKSFFDFVAIPSTSQHLQNMEQEHDVQTADMSVGLTSDLSS
jgi:hypothetical protein